MALEKKFSYMYTMQLLDMFVTKSRNVIDIT